MKKIGSLRELSAPEHFVVIVVVLKTQSALGITLDVNSMAVILSPPPLPIPPLLTDGQTRKKQAHGWISIRPGWRIEEKIGKKTLQIWANSPLIYSHVSHSNTFEPNQVEHFASKFRIKNCETLTLEIFSPTLRQGGV